MSAGAADDRGAADARGAGAPVARARLFVALELPVRVRATLAGWAGHALGAQTGARLLDAESLHVTLCFLGGTELRAVEAITAALEESVPHGAVSGPIGFEVAEVRWLPPRRPRVCAVALRDRNGEGATLQAALSARLSEDGWYEPERRRWLAHVTVARISPGAHGAGRAAEPEPPVLAPFPATAVALMRSWPGSRYEVLTRVALGGPGSR